MSLDEGGGGLTYGSMNHATTNQWKPAPESVFTTMIFTLPWSAGFASV